MPEPLPFSDDALAEVRDGMNAVRNEPAARPMPGASPSPASRWRARPAPRRCASSRKEEHLRGVTKNDSLPWKLRDHALFIAFAPVANPRYACA